MVCSCDSTRRCRGSRGAFPPGRRHSVFENQGLLAIAFFEVTAFIVLLVLFFLLRRDHSSGYFQLWLGGWACLTIASQFELAVIAEANLLLRLGMLAMHMTALLLFL